MKTVTRRKLLMTLPAWGISTSMAKSALAQIATDIPTVAKQPGQLESKLDMTSSSTRLVDVFNWAKAKAMTFAFDRGDPVGPWDEAVEPGREGFCVRDTCHQAFGAHALGLARFNLNMFRRFADCISDARDWCSYWEINRFNQPCPVDYESTSAFWYNLPGNFDLVETCFRMYVWTGDPAYINDPVFLNLYDRTVNDYVERWGLAPEYVMSRPRLMNVKGILNPKDRFVAARGIPSYNEADHTFVVGFDLLLTQRAAYLAYAQIQLARNNPGLADTFTKKAAAIEDLITKQWWNKDGQCFYARLNADHKLIDSSGPRPGGPYLSADWHKDAASNAGGFQFPNDPDAAMARLMDMGHGNLQYPEVPFTRVGDIIAVGMGISLEYSAPINAITYGGWVEIMLHTLSGLGTKVEWAQVRNLPVRDSVFTIRHDGARRTTVTNQEGPSVIWKPQFEGKYQALMVNGHHTKATTETNSRGRTTSTARVRVGPGDTVVVEVPS